MGARRGQKLIGVYVEEALADRFHAWARRNGGGASPALRKLITDAVGDSQLPEVRGRGTGQQIGVRFREAERALVAEAAQARGTTPANWLRSLAVAQLARRPQWTPAEVQALRDVFAALRSISADMTRLAETSASGQQAAPALAEAASAVRTEMRRVVAMMTGNLDYWGALTDAVPQSQPGAVEKAVVRTRPSPVRRKRRPRRSPQHPGPDE